MATKLTKSDDGKPVRLRLDPAEHQALRVAAAKRGLPMSQFVRETVLREISKSAKG